MEGQIYGEFAIGKALVAMAVENPYFVDEQRVLYKVMHIARVVAADAQTA